MKNPLKRSDWRALLKDFKDDLAGTPQQNCLDPISNAMDVFHDLDAEEINLSHVGTLLSAAKKFRDCALKNKDSKQKKEIGAVVSEVSDFQNDLKSLLQKSQNGVFLKTDWQAMQKKEFANVPDTAQTCMTKMNQVATAYQKVDDADVNLEELEKVSEAIDAFKICMKKQLAPATSKHDALATKTINEMETDANKYIASFKTLIKNAIS